MAFAGSTLLAAATLVGSDENEGVVPAAADRMIVPQGMQQQDYRAGNPVDPEGEIFDIAEEDVAFASDEDLIDDAEGFDPTPMSDTPDPVLLDADPMTGDGIEAIAEPGADDTLPGDERRYGILE